MINDESDRPVVVIDIEATDLDVDKAIPVEVAWWHLGTGERGCFVPRHDVALVLETADPKALEINGYRERLLHAQQDDGRQAMELHDLLHGVTLAGSNVAGYDAPLMWRLWPHAANWSPWHYRIDDVPNMAKQELHLPWTPGLADVAVMLGTAAPTHGAAADVTAAGEAYLQLRALAAARIRDSPFEAALRDMALARLAEARAART